jgi:hypothetical protein
VAASTIEALRASALSRRRRAPTLTAGFVTPPV